MHHLLNRSKLGPMVKVDQNNSLDILESPLAGESSKCIIHLGVYQPQAPWSNFVCSASPLSQFITLNTRSTNHGCAYCWVSQLQIIVISLPVFNACWVVSKEFPWKTKFAHELCLTEHNKLRSQVLEVSTMLFVWLLIASAQDNIGLIESCMCDPVLSGQIMPAVASAIPSWWSDILTRHCPQNSSNTAHAVYGRDCEA